MTVRPYDPSDLDDLVEVCIGTADNGSDATGLLDDDLLWAELYLLPYLERHPDLAFVVEDDRGRAHGYIVATDDTDAFEAWFRDEWWPPRRAAYAASRDQNQADLVASADSRAPGVWAHEGTHPAHLHIDLLPDAQGKGWGTTLISYLAVALGHRGVPGVHAVASAENVGAAAFYPKAGFEELTAPQGSRAFGLDLQRDPAST